VRDWRFTTAAVLILGLAIGANTAIFSVVNAVLFRDSPFADPDRLVNIHQNDPAGKPLVVISYDSYKEMAQSTDIFAATMAATIPVPARYLHEGGVRNGTAEYATAAYLDVLVGIGPANHRGTLDVGLVTDFWLPVTALRADDKLLMRLSYLE
jgi:hypothetical protein